MSVSDSSLALRRAFGAFATGVTVVTAARPDGTVSGMTVNSFSSVSLEPRLVLWCLGDECERYDTFAEADFWGVSVLDAGAQGAALRFARAATETATANELEDLEGVAVLKGGIAQFACSTYERRQAGDHLIIIGEVLGFRAAPGDGLSFFRGQYGSVADLSGPEGGS